MGKLIVGTLLAVAAAWGQGSSNKTRNEVEAFNPNIVRAEQHFGETGGQQVGGVVDGQLVMWGLPGGNAVGVLRCPGNQAIVGARVVRGSALDYLGLICATPRMHKYRNRQYWAWPPNGATYGPGVGNAAGGSNAFDLVCSSQYMVSGFLAYTRDNGKFLHDIQLECGLLLNGPVLSLSGFNEAPFGYPVFQRQAQRTRNDNNFSRITGQRQGIVQYRTWASRLVNGQRTPYMTGSGYDAIQPMTLCDDGGASGISYGLGLFGMTRTKVVQAVALYCAGSGVTDTHAARKDEFTY